ncbi:MAG: FmdB family transcriptional regulator [Candidatus Eremiobacteraeota bacterium]|nr:FmdB family transcriptional regulator [Candidatus Eremiobacteraeota bacterium]
MPLYDYQCAACKKVSEIRHGFDERLAQECASCGGKLNRLFNPTGIVFKGSGFYITDSRKAEAKTTEKPESKPSDKSDTSTGAKTDAGAPSPPVSSQPEKATGKPSAA